MDRGHRVSGLGRLAHSRGVSYGRGTLRVQVCPLVVRKVRVDPVECRKSQSSENTFQLLLVIYFIYLSIILMYLLDKMLKATTFILCTNLSPFQHLFLHNNLLYSCGFDKATKCPAVNSFILIHRGVPVS